VQVFTVSGKVKRDSQGRFVRTFCVLNDVSRYEASERDLVYAAQHDTMTGLYSKSYYATAIRELVERGDFPASVVIGDIDGLKLVNDAHGYERGDEIIRAAGRLLEETVGDAGMVARIGGDMFAILLPNCSKQAAGDHMLRMEQALEAYNARLPEGALPLHLSLGYGTQAEPADNLEAAVREAETFMFQRKLFEDNSPQSALMKSILSTMNEKSFETEAHAERLVAISALIGREMGLDSLEIDKLHLLSLTHDIGKIIIPDPILNKPGKLTDEEWQVMRTHTEIGFRIAAASPGLSVVAEAILAHHEKWNGTGSPRGLAGEEIPLPSRILAVADAFDAMITERPCRKPMSVSAAIAEIERCTESQFDPAVADVFLRLAREGRLDDILQAYPQA
ncbi:MAG: diguanylate cyclase, partial [Clostridiaceae bacterium]|nr:diguanylate cyclase [Clostridiaceae bacterium]